jgi:hypothetical protein
MSAGAVLVLAAAVEAGAANACDTAARIARLGHAVCALRPGPDGVRPERCDGESGRATGSVVVDDGASLWIGLPGDDACDGPPPGLLRRDRGGGPMRAFRGTDSGPCGFRVHDLLLRDDTLWVATDLGVSRLRVSPDDWDEWTHFAVSADGGLEETACGALLMEVAEAAREPGGQEVGRWLAEFRPRFVRRLPRGMRPASTTARRRDEQAVGHAERAGSGRGSHVHPRPVDRPQAARDGGCEGREAAADVDRARKGVP